MTKDNEKDIKIQKEIFLRANRSLAILGRMFKYRGAGTFKTYAKNLGDLIAIQKRQKPAIN